MDVAVGWWFASQVALSPTLLAAVCVAVLYGLYYVVALVSPVELRRPRDSGSDKTRHPLTEKLLARCSLLHGRYWPSPWIFSGHLDALVMMKLRPKHDPQYRREELVTEDGTTLLLDWAERKDASEGAPVFILLTGVTGSSRSSYITYLARECRQRGWHCVALNYPGTMGEKLTSPRLYSTWEDVKCLVDHVAARYPSAPIFAMGFSLGGFLLTKYLGHVEDKTPLKAAIICSSPWSQAKLSELWKGWAMTNVYGRHFVKHFLKIYHYNHSVFQDHPKLNHNSVISCKTLQDLHTHLYAPLSGALTMEEYYSAHDAGAYFGRVKIPTLVFHATNDPVVPNDVVPFDEIAKNPLSIFAVTRTGGHGGWPSGMLPLGLSWVERACLEYIDAHLDLMQSESKDK